MTQTPSKKTQRGASYPALRSMIENRKAAAITPPASRFDELRRASPAAPKTPAPIRPAAAQRTRAIRPGAITSTATKTPAAGMIVQIVGGPHEGQSGTLISLIGTTARVQLHGADEPVLIDAGHIISTGRTHLTSNNKPVPSDPADIGRAGFNPPAGPTPG